MMNDDNMIVQSNVTITVACQPPESNFPRLSRSCCLKYLMHPSRELSNASKGQYSSEDLSCNGIQVSKDKQLRDDHTERD